MCRQFGAGELSPEGIVSFNGHRDRFDQAVGQGWFVLAIEAATDDLLTPAQQAQLAHLGGRMLSVGADAATHDVATQDSAYTDWMTAAGARYAILRPDFYVAATANSPEDLRAALTP